MEKANLNIRKNDKVKVVTGKDKGKIGKVLSVDREKNHLVVENVNMIKRHTRPNIRNRQGGIIEKEARPKVIIRNKTYIDLYVRPQASVEKRHEIMTEWYRAQLKKQIPAIIEKWEKRLDMNGTGWKVKRMKTKWGSCNIEEKRIWINLELAKKPPGCLEYIIVHEMVHLMERHHNEQFLYYMDKFLPTWKQLKSELNKLPVSHADWNY